jgi:prepilin-type N-terminal cleavage/methylation domain-containing protein
MNHGSQTVKTASANRGFSLVELMIAMTLGLIVIGSVLTLFVSISQSNANNLRSTRLTQELRAVSELIARDLRRARFLDGSIAQIGRGNSADSRFSAISISGSCIRYGYQNAPMGNFRSVSRRGSTGLGSIVLAAGATSPACTAGGLTLSSPEVDITALTFTEPVANLIEITVSGRLRATPDATPRTFIQSVRVRSTQL